MNSSQFLYLDKVVLHFASLKQIHKYRSQSWLRLDRVGMLMMAPEEYE